jgi:Restriction endonuclease
METPEALERQVSRIHELLERSSNVVTWDDHIPDPDNPRQLRQVDITVRRDGKLTIVECRLSRRRQNVKWIEELIGRRQSLGAQAIIAVASAGFTSGAEKKAARYGVFLRDLRHLSDEEITNWGGQTTLMLYYYQYSDVRLTIGFAPQSVPSVDSAILSQELRSHDVLQSIFNAAAEQLDTLKLLVRNDARTIRFGVLVRPEGVRLCGEPVLEIGLEGKARLVKQTIASSKVMSYGRPAPSATPREVTVEQFELGETSIVHHDDRIAIDIDLSSVELPDLSQIRYFRTISSQQLEHESFAITDPGKVRVGGRLAVDLYALRL